MVDKEYWKRKHVRLEYSKGLRDSTLADVVEALNIGGCGLYYTKDYYSTVPEGHIVFLAFETKTFPDGKHLERVLNSLGFNGFAVIRDASNLFWENEILKTYKDNKEKYEAENKYDGTPSMSMGGD